MCPGFCCPHSSPPTLTATPTPPAVVTLLPPFERTFLFTTLVYTLAQHSLQNEGHAWMLGFPVSMSSSCLHHRNSVLQALLYSCSFCHLMAGGLMVFSAVQWCCFLFVWSRRWYRHWARKKQDYMRHCAILIQLDLEWKWIRKNHTAKLINPNRNGTVWYLAVSTQTLGPSSWGGGGEMLAVTVSSFRF